MHWFQHEMLLLGLLIRVLIVSAWLFIYLNWCTNISYLVLYRISIQVILNGQNLLLIFMLFKIYSTRLNGWFTTLSFFCVPSSHRLVCHVCLWLINLLHIWYETFVLEGCRFLRLPSCNPLTCSIWVNGYLLSIFLLLRLPLTRPFH